MRLPASDCRAHTASPLSLLRQCQQYARTMARLTALSFVLFLALFEIGSCIRCRQCNSQNDPTCADPYTSTKPSVECESPDSESYNRQYLSHFLPKQAYEHLGSPVKRYCHKIVTGTGTVIRACLDANSVNANYTCELLDKIGQVKYCSACVKDDCNGASAAVASLPLALTLLASFFYFK